MLLLLFVTAKKPVSEAFAVINGGSYVRQTVLFYDKERQLSTILHFKAIKRNFDQ